MPTEQYKTGAASFTSASQIVTFSGGAQLLTDGVGAGHVIKRDLDGAPACVIGSVDSETQVTLVANYAGDTAATVAYMIHRSFTPVQGLARPQQSDADLADILRELVIDKIDNLLAGAGGENAVQVLYKNFTEYTGPADTNENDAKVYAMPANILDTDHKSLRIHVTGENGGNSSVIRFRFGATLVSFYSLVTSKKFMADIIVGRRGSSSEIVASYYKSDGTTGFYDRDEITEDLTGALDVKVSVQTAGGGGGTIIDGMTVELLP